ncbi:non-homologous end-joining factor 1-like [Antedon mediterranea]|uniref:non-homologous end-joining factor 1-like n=1 Tax=Antedon mediterranea TaxID=105859 RepID=UPI003AF7C294
MSVSEIEQGLEHSLTEQTWQPWKFGGTSVLVKKLFTHSSYQIAIFDFKQMWFENCTTEMFSNNVKDLNPNIEAPMATLLQHIQDNLSSSSEALVDLKMEYLNQENEQGEKRSKLTIHWTSQLIGGVPFIWQFKLKEGDSQQELCSHLVTPLLTMVSEMSRRESELTKQLSKKDAEIEDYKMAGGKVSRKYLQTSQFNEETFRQDMNTSKAFEKHILTCGISAFSGTTGELYKEIQIKQLRQSMNQGVADTEMVDGSSASGTPASSPTKSLTPHQSPIKNLSPDGSPAKDTEMLRRQALERKLNEERTRLESKKKKKKIF